MKPAHLWNCLLSIVLLATTHALAASRWDEPATALAQKIEGVLGAGQTKLVLRNQSSLSSQDVATIRRLLESGLKQRGVVIAGDDSASEVRVTLSENVSQRIWIAEIVQGTETKVVMTLAGSLGNTVVQSQASILLQAVPLLSSPELLADTNGASGASAVLSVASDDAGLIVLRADHVSFYKPNASGFTFLQALPLSHKHAIPRDPRGRIILHSDGHAFTVYLPGLACEGTRPTLNEVQEVATVRCEDSDDPWPLVSVSSAENSSLAIPFRAFYNSTRDYFTGVITPALSFDLPPFFDAVELPRAGETALLVRETSGAAEWIEHASRKPISGIRDWGSDFAVLRAPCGADPVVLVSASGEAVSDSLRAYTIPSQEAIAASAPLAVDGTVMAMARLNDSTAAVIVRSEDGLGSSHDEVLRVTTHCN